MATNSDPSLLFHPNLGRIRGIASNDKTTIQYRNLKFAIIPGRWEDPILFSQPAGDTELEACLFGPMCPQTPDGIDIDLSLLGKVALRSKDISYSELECLNLVVTVPLLESSKPRKLPVMVWIHGGGFCIGGNSFPQYDLAKFVTTSVELKQPVITVSVNYRLGIFGFLCCDELGLGGNFGLKDQVCAFQWIERNIAGFGGDAENITAFGESAGAIALSALLLSDKPLFSRAVLMSGQITLRSIRDSGWHNSHYKEILRFLNLENSTFEERRNLLYSIKAEDLVKALPVFQHWSPSVDGILITTAVDISTLADVGNTAGKPNWCKEIVIGDMKHDGTILNSRFSETPDALKRIERAKNLLLTDIEGEKLLHEYGINLSKSVKSNRIGLIELITDLRFYFATIKVHEGWETSPLRKAFRYHVHQPNPFHGPQENLASHELDVAILFHNLNEFLPPPYLSLGRKLVQLWISFASGLGWAECGKGELIRIGPNEEIICYEKIEYDKKYRNNRGNLLQEFGWKTCFDFGEILQGCYY